ncbi:hypothetical protein CASFOL_039312 [Castilleja foliolosa]|uniref:Uncharacterized protein n=1 Tax=Castilleja foliolosa TaxID=1961234 RepID=A0ABD3BHM9_9LAMI
MHPCILSQTTVYTSSTLSPPPTSSSAAGAVASTATSSLSFTLNDNDSLLTKNLPVGGTHKFNHPCGLPDLLQTCTVKHWIGLSNGSAASPPFKTSHNNTLALPMLWIRDDRIQRITMVKKKYHRHKMKSSNCFVKVVESR